MEAIDAQAADAYEHLAVTFPDLLRSEHAWLFCRAAQQHGCGGTDVLALFARTFREEAAARQFFAHRRWDFDEVEFTFLERSGARQPGRFPECLGPEYASRGERFLRETDARCVRVRRLENRQVSVREPGPAQAGEA